MDERSAANHGHGRHCSNTPKAQVNFVINLIICTLVTPAQLLVLKLQLYYRSIYSRRKEVKSVRAQIFTN